MRKLGNEATLHIKSAEPSNDFGVYRCNVEDDNGVVIGSAYTAVSVGYSGSDSGPMLSSKLFLISAFDKKVIL